MIQPRNSLRDGSRGRTLRNNRPLEQVHGDPEGPRRRYLAVSSFTTAVLGNDHVDRKGLEQSPVRALRERPAGEYVVGVRYIERRFNGINATDQIEMLRRPVEGRELLPPDREKYPSGRIPHRLDGMLGVSNVDPHITCDMSPRWSAQGKNRRVGSESCMNSIGGNRRGVRVRCIDDKAYLVRAQILHKALDTSKPAAPHGNRLRSGRRGSTCQRQCDNAVPVSKSEPQLARLRGTSQNQYMRAHD